MNSEDETRVMPISDEVRSLMMGRTPNPDAETPCVGIPSVGDTHFGETQVAHNKVDTGVKIQPIGTVNVQPRVPFLSSSSPSSSGDFLSSLSAALFSRTWVSSVPRPVALGIGASLGIGGALLIGLLQNGDGAPRSAPVESAQVEALVQTDDGTGVPEVPVRVRNQVVLTDEAGRAPFPPILLDGPLSVKAECPSGYAGGRLVREIPKAVAAASKSWSFRLVCRPEFSEVSMVVETKGCGEMRIWVDGTLSGTTTSGSLTLSRRVQSAEVVEVRAEPTSGKCDFEKVHHATLSAAEKTSRVLFEGKSLRAPARRRVKAPAAPVRPYRL